MKTWNTPELQELDVRLTASGALDSTTEKLAMPDENGTWQPETHNSATHEWNGNYENGCVGTIKTSTAS